jgi:hypothetical protein
MKKAYLALAFLITGFLMTGDAYGEDGIYYCASTNTTGFLYDKKEESYKPSLFETLKFKLKLDKESNFIEIKGHSVGPVNTKFTCTAPYPLIAPDELSCTGRMYHFNLNANNGRFVLALAAGYVNGDGDSITVAYGKCDKF